MDSTYAKVGVQVILWKNNPRFWGASREPYLGKTTEIAVLSVDRKRCQVHCDNGAYVWFVSEMILASEASLLTEADKRLLR